LSILKAVAMPTDFVSFKLDIDQPEIEQAFVEEVRRLELPTRSTDNRNINL
jgi:hypothetical protein